MNKVRIIGVVGGLVIAIVFLTKIDYNNLNCPRNLNYSAIITAALFFSISNIITWEKKN